nr:adenosine deaminase [Bacilli bacterium]
MNNVLNKIDSMNNLVELHMHLDGAISINNAKKLASLQGINLPSDEEVIKLMQVSKDCHDLNEFLTKFDFPLSLMQTKESIILAVKNLSDELVSQGIMYAEIRFAPQLHTNKGLTQEEVINAAIEGMKLSNLKSNLILCTMRGAANDKNIETVRLAKKYLGKGVVAIDLAGAEGLYKTSEHKYIFDLAKELNVPYTIHAGEADGPSSVDSAISFGTKRIGHGVRSSEDISIVNEIKNKDITLEVCPTSNICTSIYNKVGKMPIKLFMDNDINITINTDDPSICNTSLKEELKKVASAFNLSYQDILKFEENAVNASFADDETKKELLNKIRN